jgi:hypothetical protein
MGGIKEFKKLQRRWYVEVAFEFIALVGFGFTYFTHGDTNTLIFWLAVGCMVEN